MTKWLMGLSREQWSNFVLLVAFAQLPIHALWITGAIIEHWYGNLLIACGLGLLIAIWLVIYYLYNKRWGSNGNNL